MVNVSAQFEKAVAIVKELPPDGPVKPTQDQQLEFYGLFKQANEGDNTGAAPGAFNFTAKYKYNAWKKLEGTSKDDAKAKYVALLKSMLEKADDATSKKHLADLEAAGQ
ncbi:acyl-CoA-binding protein (ACBP)/diazepam binding inhibitor (DBI)/endozepine (EP) [Cryptotrichosporon argae]